MEKIKAKKDCMLGMNRMPCDEDCQKCGWNETENKRRRGLKLEKDENGIRRMHVGQNALQTVRIEGKRKTGLDKNEKNHLRELRKAKIRDGV